MFSVSKLLSILRDLEKISFEDFRFINCEIYDRGSYVEAKLRIYNLSKETRILSLVASDGIKIDIPTYTFEEDNWDSSEKDWKKRDLSNSWLRIPSYLQSRAIAVVTLKIKKEGHLVLKDLQSPDSITLRYRVTGESNKNLLEYKVGVKKDWVDASKIKMI